MARKDILLDQYGNYKVENGDFVIGDSRVQDAKEVIELNKGERKHYPTVGCNPIEWQDSNMPISAIERRIKLECEKQGLLWDEIKPMIDITE